jgi:hypothetical protein
LVALTVVVSMPLLGMAGIASAKTVKAAPNCVKHPNKPKCLNSTGGGGSSTGGGTGQGTPQIVLTNSPDLIETGQSEIHAVLQVETLPSFAGDLVTISSSQLDASCETVEYETIQDGFGPTVDSPTATVVLDDDGNVTVVLNASNCAPGSDVIEADLDEAPYLTALDTLVADPPVVTTPGIYGYPSPEVETGDTLGGLNGASGDSDVYAVFYVEDDPVYAEMPVEIGSSQLESRCGGGWNWEAGNGGTGVGPEPAGPNTGTEATTTLDDDGNAVFVFEGISCAAGDSQVIADVLAGSHDTFYTTFTISAPAPTI